MFTVEALLISMMGFPPGFDWNDPTLDVAGNLHSRPLWKAITQEMNKNALSKAETRSQASLRTKWRRDTDPRLIKGAFSLDEAEIADAMWVATGIIRSDFILSLH